MSRKVAEGGDTFRLSPADRAQFDLPLPSKADLTDDRQRKSLVAAAQDARELRLDADTPNLPDLSAVKGRVGRADGYALDGPRARANLLSRAYFAGSRMAEISCWRQRETDGKLAKICCCSSPSG